MDTLRDAQNRATLFSWEREQVKARARRAAREMKELMAEALEALSRDADHVAVDRLERAMEMAQTLRDEI